MVTVRSRFLRHAAHSVVVTLSVLGFLTSCQSAPPQLSATIPDVPDCVRLAAKLGLVPVTTVCPGALPQLRYATTNNFVSRAVYPAEMPCLLSEGTAAKLRAAQLGLAKHGLQLVIWDAWRPPEVQLIFWNLIRNPDYVAKPTRGRWSWHCYGRAVDVTLADTSGKVLPMPTDFDDFSPKAKADYAGDPQITARLRLLQTEMRRAGFQTLDSEWWHFSDPVDPHPVRPVFAADLGLLRKE